MARRVLAIKEMVGRMGPLADSLIDIADRLDQLTAKGETPRIRQSIKSLNDSIAEAATAFCGSWIGYHSCVYYADLAQPPPGARFSVEWGLIDRHFFEENRGDWVEFSRDELYNALKSTAKGLAFDELISQADEVARGLTALKEEVLSVLTAITESNDDAYIKRLLEKAHGMKLLSVRDIIGTLTPHGQVMTRDSLASSGGLKVPPHINLLAQVNVAELHFRLPKALADLARQAAAHLNRKKAAGRDRRRQGTKVFIGHGRAGAWRELKDFIRDRLELDWDEFNRVPVAGVTNIARLSEMLEEACIAFLVMTAEDEMKDGKVQARMNVIHEAGLFQGRLGFSKAVIVLEEGCEEFSNVQGLGQIRFPAGKIKAAFEEVRQVLEREGVLGEV